MGNTIRFQFENLKLEIFQPHYALSILEFILKRYHTEKDKKFQIFEIGGGNGTFCKNILDYLKENEKEVYENIKYEIIEISSELSKLQTELMKDHNGKFISHNISIFDWKNIYQDNCIVIALEVLDNLPHDKITLSGGEYFETHLDENNKEILEPLQDELMIRYNNLIDFRKGYYKDSIFKNFKSLYHRSIRVFFLSSLFGNLMN
jgi:SAM-dependent MidA family methyltransferase